MAIVWYMMQLKANVMHVCDYRGQNDRQSGVLSVQTRADLSGAQTLICHTKDFWMCGAITRKLKKLSCHLLYTMLSKANFFFFSMKHQNVT